MRIEEGPDGLHVAAAGYRLDVALGSPWARLSDAHGRPWAELLLDASLHTRSGLDETVARQEPLVRIEAERWSAVVPLVSSLWRRKELVLEGDERSLRLAAVVEGDGQLSDVHLLGAWTSAQPAVGTGFHRSGAAFRTLFSPEPADPARLCRPASEPAILDVFGGAGPGRGHWFFTPPPFCFAVSRRAAPRDGSLPDGGDDGAADGERAWLAIGLAGPAGVLGFGAVHYEPAERSFSLRLAYEGQTRVAGRFETPAVVLLPGASDPYAALAAWASDLRGRGLAPQRPEESGPSWWREPMFCGWGAQAALVREQGGRPADHATQAAYDGFLAALEREGLRPGTIVVDDRWQAAYGSGVPDASRWPDLRGWIADRHAAGQRVLLWWKAWDPEGVPAELCVRNAAGAAVAVDPSNPSYEAFLRAAVRGLLGPAGLDADGLKVDFTAMTPSGPGLRRHGPEWGTSLLLRLLWILHDEAHRVRPDALVITHSPHPSFAAVTDMLRLNDMLRLAEPDDEAAVVAQMRHRAGIVEAVCPGVPIDTDDWCAPDLASWRRWLACKQELEPAVLSLYYATTLDRTGEALEAADYAALRAAWTAARDRNAATRSAR